MLTLLLPGAGGSAAFWKPLADELDGEQVLMSWPGLGNEPPDASVKGFSDLVDLARTQINQPVSIIAQSMGGAVDSQMKCEFCIKTGHCMELINGTLLPSPEPRRTPQAGQMA